MSSRSTNRTKCKKHSQARQPTPTQIRASIPTVDLIPNPLLELLYILHSSPVLLKKRGRRVGHHLGSIGKCMARRSMLTAKLYTTAFKIAHIIYAKACRRVCEEKAEVMVKCYRSQIVLCVKSKIKICTLMGCALHPPTHLEKIEAWLIEDLFSYLSILSYGLHLMYHQSRCHHQSIANLLAHGHHHPLTQARPTVPSTKIIMFLTLQDSLRCPPFSNITLYTFHPSPRRS